LVSYLHIDDINIYSDLILIINKTSRINELSVDMAAVSNEEKTSSLGEDKRLSQLLNDLWSLHEVCDRRMQYYESLCNKQRILLQPWPIKHADERNENKPPNTTDEVFEKPVVSNPALDKANKLLGQAQRLREKQSQKALTKIEVSNEQNSSDKIPKTCVVEQDTHLPPKSSEHNDPNTTSTPTSQNGSEIENTGKSNSRSIGLISQSKLDQLNGRETKTSTSDTTKSCTGQNRPVSGQQKPSSGRSTPLANQQRPVWGQNKPSSGQKKPSSGQNRVTTGQARPTSAQRKTKIHMSAPFHTTPEYMFKHKSSSLMRKITPVTNVKTPSTYKKPTTSSQKKSVTKPTAKATPRLNNPTRSLVNTNACNGASEQDSDSSNSTTSGKNEGSNSMTNETVSSYANNEHNINEEKCRAPIHIENEFPKLTLHENDNIPEDVFTLKKKGGTLTFPAKFRRSYACNRKLRRQLAQRLVTVNVNKDKTAQQTFVERLEDHIDSGTAKKNSYQNLLTLCSAYQHLEETIQAISWHDVTDASSWMEVLKAKRSYEFVLHSFIALEEQYQGIVKEPDANSHWQAVTGKLHGLQPESKRLWLPAELLKDTLHFHPLLQYKSVKKMNEHTDLLHHIQFSLLRQHVMKALAVDNFTSLSTHNHTSPYHTVTGNRQFIATFRMIYTTLLNYGSAFPAMILDSIE